MRNNASNWERFLLKSKAGSQQASCQHLLCCFSVFCCCPCCCFTLLGRELTESCWVLAKIKIQSYFTQLNQISHPVRWPRHLINTSWQQQLISLELAMKRVFPNSPSPKQNHLLFFFSLASNTPYSGIMLSFALVDFQNQHYSSHSGSLYFYTHTYTQGHTHTCTS